MNVEADAKPEGALGAIKPAKRLTPGALSALGAVRPSAPVIASIAFLGLALVAAHFYPVADVLEAEGRLLPAGGLETVHHPEGGVIQDILVRDGDAVEAGQVLVRLDPAEARAALEAAERESLVLAFEGERLRALMEGREPAFLSLAEPGVDPALVEEQRARYEEQQTLAEERRSALEAKIDDHWGAIRRAQVEETTLARNAQLLAEELELRETLFQQGLSSKIEYLAMKRRVNDARGDLARMIERREQLEAKLVQARQREETFGDEVKRVAQIELAALAPQVEHVSGRVARARDRLNRIEIGAPETGRVRGLRTRNVGDAIPPGGAVLEVVPLGEAARAEAVIPALRAAAVAEEQKVRVSLRESGDVGLGGLFGGSDVTGTVTALEGQDGGGQDGSGDVRVVISLADDPASETTRLESGRAIEVNIVVGTRSLLEKLSTPIITFARRAFGSG